MAATTITTCRVWPLVTQTHRQLTGTLSTAVHLPHNITHIITIRFGHGYHSTDASYARVYKRATLERWQANLCSLNACPAFICMSYKRACVFSYKTVSEHGGIVHTQNAQWREHAIWCELRRRNRSKQQICCGWGELWKTWWHNYIDICLRVSEWVVQYENVYVDALGWPSFPRKNQPANQPPTRHDTRRAVTMYTRNSDA